MVADRSTLNTRPAWAPLTVFVALAIAGCNGAAPPASAVGETPTPTESASPTVSLSPSSLPEASPSAEPSPSASPSTFSSGPFGILPAEAPLTFKPGIACSGTIGANDAVAIVELHGSSTDGGTTVLRDYADLSKPRSVCTFQDTSILQLVDPRHVVIYGEGVIYAVVDLPVVRYHWFKLPSPASSFGVDFIAMAPGLDRIAWRVSRPDGSASDEIHLTNTSGDRVVATLPDTNEGRCGSSFDSNPGAFTRSGTALFILDTPLPEISLAVVAGEKTVLSDVGSASEAPAIRPLRALWSPTTESLYYTKNGALWRWTPSAGRVRYLAGVTWTSASISPDGIHLAYAVAHADGTSDVYLVDLVHGGSPVRIGKGHRDAPVFLNNVQLWFLGVGWDGCTGGGPSEPLIYNIANGTESPSVIDRVVRVWPATDSQF